MSVDFKTICYGQPGKGSVLTYVPWSDRQILHGFCGRTTPQLESLGPEFSQPLLLKQVHSTRIISCDSGNLGADNILPEGDGWLGLGSTHSRICAIKTADCIPVLFRFGIAGKQGLSAALHCGWRGVVAGIIDRLLERLGQHSVALEGVECVLGPGAHKCCYEIGADTADEFRRYARTFQADSAVGVVERNGKIFGDLPGLIAERVRRADLPAAKIVDSGICTICSSEFFSYRREGAASGRNLSFVAT